MARASSTGVRGLFRGANGRLYIDLRWKDASGAKRRHKENIPQGTSSAAAKRRAQLILNEALAGTLTTARATDTATLAPAFNEYLASLEARGLRSMSNRRSHAKLWCGLLGDDRALDKIAPKDLERFVARESATKAPATINRALATLKAFARWARGQGKMSPAVAADIRAHRLLREPPGRVRHLEEREEKALLDALAALDAELRTIVVVAILSGMRRSEITSLRRAQVDLRHREISLTRTKSNRSRKVPISDDLARILEPLVEDPSDGHVFHITLGPGRGRGIEARRAERATRGFKAVVDATGITDLRLHDMRHDFATRVRRSGAGLDVIQKLLGHSTIAMASRYAHVGDRLLHDAVAGMSKPAGV